jgi:two-component system NtrC family response regulator
MTGTSGQPRGMASGVAPGGEFASEPLREAANVDSVADGQPTSTLSGRASPLSPRPLLIVEDDPALQKQMLWAFDRYETIVANDRASAIVQVRRYEPAVVTMDLGLPPHPDDPSEGLALLAELYKLVPETKVIVLTGQNDRDNALKAINLGAHDFCTKPFEPELLTWTIERAFRVHELQEENARLQMLGEAPAMSGMVTRDPQMLRVCRTIEKVAPTSATVLILGESGTGKELVARALHELSPRRGGRFVAINCAAIPENLLESELFGYEKGAFTGAVKQTIGKFEVASGGTLFLDEIGDLPMGLQAKLLRFLQERVIERIGGRQEIPVDVRVVCATHRGLKDLIEQGRFREDLYYRLAEIVVEIPPLRQRQGDAALLAHVFVRKYAAEQRRGAMTLLPDAIDAIDAHAWGGNVRELENVIKRAVIMADGTRIGAVELGLVAAADDANALNLRQVREQAETSAVLRALGRANGNLSKAAELLGVSRPTLYDLMHRFGLK